MKCAVQSCRSEGRVYLSRSVKKPNWFCAFCASRLLETINPFSFVSLSEMSIAQERQELAKMSKE